MAGYWLSSAVTNMSRALIFGVAIAALFATAASAAGCGIELNAGHADNTCSDPQCTRNYSGFCVRGFLLNESCGSEQDCYLDLTCSNGTCAKKAKGSKNAGIGLVAAVIATLCFGSSFVPIKRYKKYVGDGVFSQFLMCFGRFFVGCVILLTRENKQFYPFAALGGLFWAAGNAISVPIIQCVGMALGIAVWGTTNMLLGWASGAFGLWGVKQEHPAHPALSYLGAAFSLASILLFVFVEPYHPPTAEEKSAFDAANDGEEEKEKNLQGKTGAGYGSMDTVNAAAKEGDGTTEPLLDADVRASHNNEADGPAMEALAPGMYEEPPMSPTHPKHPTISDVIGKKKARIVGITLALIAGALFGLCMDPAQVLMGHYIQLGEEQDAKFTPYGFDYVFSFTCGAITFAFVYLFVYSALRMAGIRPSDRFFNPVEHDKVILPSFLNGMIGSCGSAFWFYANQNLGLMVSFPIIAAGPGVVSALWGVLVFHEIKGMRNYLLLAGAFVAVVLSSVFSALGKGD